MPHAPAGWRPAALVAVLLFSVAAALNTAPAAKAETGRRLGIYVENYDKASASVKAPKPSATGTGTVSYTSYVSANLTVVLNYKKDGKCPDVYSLTSKVRPFRSAIRIMYRELSNRRSIVRIYISRNRRQGRLPRSLGGGGGPAEQSFA